MSTVPPETTARTTERDHHSALRELLRGEPDVAAHVRDPARKRRYVAALFDLVAPRYDRFTRWFSYGMDRWWKRELVDRWVAAVPAGGVVLDLACGTGDLALAAAARTPHRVVACDLSRAMLRMARARARREPGTIRFLRGDMEALPLLDASADAVLVAYGLRNAGECGRALVEIARVLKPGGWLFALDFYQPPGPTWRALFLAYLRAAGRLYGWAWHREPDAYGYIAASLRQYLTSADLASALAARSFREITVVPKLGGGICIHAARKERG